MVSVEKEKSCGKAWCMTGKKTSHGTKSVWTHVDTKCFALPYLLTTLGLVSMYREKSKKANKSEKAWNRWTKTKSCWLERRTKNKLKWGKLGEWERPTRTKNGGNMIEELVLAFWCCPLIWVLACCSPQHPCFWLLLMLFLGSWWHSEKLDKEWECGGEAEGNATSKSWEKHLPFLGCVSFLVFYVAVDFFWVLLPALAIPRSNHLFLFCLVFAALWLLTLPKQHLPDFCMGEVFLSLALLGLVLVCFWHMHGRLNESWVKMGNGKQCAKSRWRTRLLFLMLFLGIFYSTFSFCLILSGFLCLFPIGNDMNKERK